MSDGEFRLYTHDTTIYVVGPNPDMVATSLNFFLIKLTDCCGNNFLTPYQGKAEFMPLERGTFIGPFESDVKRFKQVSQLIQSHEGLICKVYTC